MMMKLITSRTKPGHLRNWNLIIPVKSKNIYVIKSYFDYIHGLYYSIVHVVINVFIKHADDADDNDDDL